MSMAQIDALERQIQALEAKQMAERYGITGGLNVLLVTGTQTIEQATRERLANVPPALLKTVRLQVVQLPWLTHRRLVGDIRASELKSEQA